MICPLYLFFLLKLPRFKFHHGLSGGILKKAEVTLFAVN